MYRVIRLIYSLVESGCAQYLGSNTHHVPSHPSMVPWLLRFHVFSHAIPELIKWSELYARLPTRTARSIPTFQIPGAPAPNFLVLCCHPKGFLQTGCSLVQPRFDLPVLVGLAAVAGRRLRLDIGFQLQSDQRAHGLKSEKTNNTGKSSGMIICVALPEI
jgi:hypothetical protein